MAVNPTDSTPVGAMPPNIQTGKKDPTSIQLAKDMRTKRYGKDVRETMARMIEWTSVLNNFLTTFYVNTSTQNSEYYRQFTDVIKELSKDKDYHSLPEIAGARGGFGTLGERLNREMFSMSRMGQDVKEAMTGGSVAVVGRNSVNTLNVMQKTIAPHQTTFISEGKNKFNKDLVSNGDFLSPSDNIDFVETYGLSHFIPVLGGVTYVLSGGARQIGIYDSEYNMLEYIQRGGPTSVSAHVFEPEFNGYVRFNVRLDLLDTVQFETGTIKSSYEPYKVKFDYMEPVSQKPHLSGKTLLNFGDSIANAVTVGVSGYAQQISNKYGMILQNYAVDGATVKVRDDNNNNIGVQIDEAISDGVAPDYIFIDGMTNDANHTSDTHGTLTGLHYFGGGLDDSLFLGALENNFVKLKQTFPNAIIIYVLPHIMAGRGLGQNNLRNLILSACEKYGIPVADVFSEGNMNTFFENQVGLYTISDSDSVHPNTLGYTRSYVPIIERLI